MESSETLSTADLEVVVALQKTELDRLLRDNARLQQRVEQLITLQEREQILRQQMQSLLGNAAGGKRLMDDRDLKARAVAAEGRYGRLKEALTLLINAIEKTRK